MKLTICWVWRIDHVRSDTGKMFEPAQETNLKAICGVFWVKGSLGLGWD